MWSIAAILFVALLYPHGPGGGAGLAGLSGLEIGAEHFQTTLRAGAESGAVVAMKNPKLFCQLSKEFPGAFSGEKTLLQYRTCMGVDDPDANYMERLREYFTTVAYYVDELEVHTRSFDAVTQAIQGSITKLYEANKNAGNGFAGLEGPAYVLVFQAPYFRDHRTGTLPDKDVIHLQPFNVAEYKYMSSGILHDKTPAAGDDDEALLDPSAAESGLKEYFPESGVAVKAFVMYPLYDKSMRMRYMPEEAKATAISTCVDFFLAHSTKEKMCRLRCPGNTDLTCGCANRKADSSAGYVSVCLGPKDKDDRQKIAKVTYGSMYRVNETMPGISHMFVNNNAFIDECTPPGKGR
jgi:hypothetical protein